MAQKRFVYYLVDPYDEIRWIVIARTAKEARLKVNNLPYNQGKSHKFYGLVKLPKVVINEGSTRIIATENYKCGI